MEKRDAVSGTNPNRTDAKFRGSLWTTISTAAMAVAIAIGALGVGVASANAPNTSAPQIHTCVTKANGAVTLVGSGAQCGSKASALGWSVRGVTFRGAWSASKTYKLNDVVTEDGSSWIAVAQQQGQNPSSSPTAWNSFASAGQPGVQGNTGQQGLKGENGPAGPVIIQSGFHDGAVYVPLESYETPIVSMTIQHPGSYIVFAKLTAFDLQNNSDSFQCDLKAGVDSDESWTEITNNPQYRSMTFNVVHTFTASDNKVVLACDDWSDTTTGAVENIKITAISVNNLINAYTSK